VNSRVVSRAVVIATGVTADGGREVLGCEVGDGEDGAFWIAFLRSLKARGLGGVQLVVSDAHTGLKQAIAAVLAGACWQRCRVHFLSNALARVPKASAEMVAAAIRTIVAQLTPAEVADQVDKVATTLQPRFPAVAALLVEATAVLIETHDEWQIADRRYLSEGSMALLAPISDDDGRSKEVRRAELVAP
jgi:putative transposase